MAGIGVLVNDTVEDGYAYKILVPSGSVEDGVVDLSTTYASIPTTVINTIINSVTNTVHANATHIKVKALVDILAGQPVKYVSFNHGQDALEVTLANQADSVSIGIAEYNIPRNTFGTIIANGLLEGIDTSMYAESAILYVDDVGTLTPTEPTTGYSQAIAYVLRVHALNGAIQITTTYPKQRANDIFIDPIAGVVSNKVQGVLEELAASGGGTQTFIDTFNIAKANADSITNTYIDGVLVSQEVVEDLAATYTITFNYTLGVLTSKVISRTLGGSVTIEYTYDGGGNLTTVTQIGGN